MEIVRRVLDEFSSGRTTVQCYQRLEERDDISPRRFHSDSSHGANVFEHAGPVPRSDRSLALHAIELKAFEMFFVGQDLRRDQDFLLEAIRRNPDSFAYVDKDLRDDFDFVRAALKVDAGTETRSFGRHASLEYVSARLRGNVTIVCEAVSREGAAADGQLDLAAVELQDDPRVLGVLKPCGPSWGHFCGEWEIAKNSMANLFPGLSIDSREFFLECTKRDPTLYKNINCVPELRRLVLSPSEHRELVLHNLLDNGFSLGDLFEDDNAISGTGELRRRWDADHEVVSKAVAQSAPQYNPSYGTMSQAALSFSFANAKLRNNWQIFSVALKTDPVGVAELIINPHPDMYDRDEDCLPVTSDSDDEDHHDGNRHCGQPLNVARDSVFATLGLQRDEILMRSQPDFQIIGPEDRFERPELVFAVRGELLEDVNFVKAIIRSWPSLSAVERLHQMPWDECNPLERAVRRSRRGLSQYYKYEGAVGLVGWVISTPVTS